MHTRRRIITVVISGLLVIAASYIGERMTRRWRAPEYHVILPLEFDIEEAIGGGKGTDTFRYSPRSMYLRYHRRGWDDAKREWLGGMAGNRMAQVPGAGNRGLRDGREQFEREKW
jgi:hypothetical protein